MYVCVYVRTKVCISAYFLEIRETNQEEEGRQTNDPAAEAISKQRKSTRFHPLTPQSTLSILRPTSILVNFPRLVLSAERSRWRTEISTTGCKTKRNETINWIGGGT